MTDNIELIALLIRSFNALVSIGLIAYLIITFRRRSMYRFNNLAYIVALLYIAGIFGYTLFFHSPITPIASAIGATINILAMLVSISSQSETKNDI